MIYIMGWRGQKHRDFGKTRLLDLYSGAGGAGAGYHAAGYEVVGVDLDPQINYPYRHVVMNALRVNLARFQIAHASPPCQKWSQTSYRTKKEYPDLLTPTRLMLDAWGGPYIIENVVGAPMIRPVMVCGAYFGLGAMCRDGVWRSLRRHRMFESNIPGLVGTGCHCRPGVPAISIFGAGSSTSSHAYTGNVREREEALKIDWMYAKEMSQAIPPIYTEFLGKQAMELIR